MKKPARFPWNDVKEGKPRCACFATTHSVPAFSPRQLSATCLSPCLSSLGYCGQGTAFAVSCSCEQLAASLTACPA